MKENRIIKNDSEKHKYREFMVKTTPLNPDTHKLLKEVQKALRERYHINMSIQEIVGHIIPSHEDSIKKIITDIRIIDDKNYSQKLKIGEKLKIDKDI